MSDLFETSRVRDDARYWDALAQRVAAEAIGRSKATGSRWLADSRANWIAASLLLTAALAFMALPADSSRARSLSAEWTQALAPADVMGRTLILAEGPPEIGELLLGGRRGGMR